MPLVKPKAICGRCGLLLQGKEVTCPSCGVEIDWQASAIQIPAEHGKGKSDKRGLQKENQAGKSSTVQTGKWFLAAVVVAAVGLILYEVVLRKTPDQSQAPVSVSQPMPMMQETEEINNLEEHVRINPGDLASVLQLANLLFDHSAYQKAIMYYKQYLEERPDDADARVDMGICYKEVGNLSEAKASMLEALKYSPKHIYAHFNLGIVALSAENMTEANEWFKKTVALDPASEVAKRAQQLLTQHNQPVLKKKN
jgi:cytochrome c-type biogenesis protein CcmH/NrfG